MMLGTGLLALVVLTLGDTPAHLSSPPPARAATTAGPTWERAPRPALVSRDVWHADERLVREQAGYSRAVKSVVVHHTGHDNDHDCADTPRLLRTMQLQHVQGRGWDDLGYNFVIDRCGTIYEGRAGGVERPVRGAHSKGFNAQSVGVGVVGTFTAGTPVPPEVLDSLAALAAWKLHERVDVTKTVRLTSHHDESRYPKGTTVRLPVISGHRDSYATDCPGEELHARLPALRQAVADLRPRD